MAKLASTFQNMFLSLFICAVVSSAALAAVYSLTQDKINAAGQQKKIDAMRAVLPEFDNDPIKESRIVATDAGELIAYPAKKNGVSVGVAVETFSDMGYSGRIVLMVGFLPDGSIKSISVISHAETPGLGSKIAPGESDFAQQFFGKDPVKFHLKVKKDGGDVDGITAATISSRAFCDAIQKAYDTVIKNGPKT